MRKVFGFSLLELLVVISVAGLLAALMMPALRQVRENANRVICLSHLQQLGAGFIMYGSDHNDRLPYSAALNEDRSPTDLMVAWRSKGKDYGWDGLGILFGQMYIPSHECFYCPSHHGDHSIDHYADLWHNPTPYKAIYTNYHYAGDITWDGTHERRTLRDGFRLVLATDGLRTQKDFNHVTGLNVLRGDGSASWRDDTENFVERLPRAGSGGGGKFHIHDIWERMSGSVE